MSHKTTRRVSTNDDNANFIGNPTDPQHAQDAYTFLCNQGYYLPMYSTTLRNWMMKLITQDDIPLLKSNQVEVYPKRFHTPSAADVSDFLYDVAILNKFLKIPARFEGHSFYVNSLFNSFTQGGYARMILDID